MKAKVRADIRWSCPFAGIISGPSRSGKTTFIFNMIKRRKELFDSIPIRIVYVYGIWQKAFEDKPHIEFVCGIDKILDGAVDFDENENNMLILDDVMEEVSSSKKRLRCSLETCTIRMLQSGLFSKTCISRVLTCATLC